MNNSNASSSQEFYRARGQQQQQQVLFSLHSDLKPLSFPSSFGALLSFSSIAIAFLVALVGFLGFL
jgi:hypothetical protein